MRHSVHLMFGKEFAHSLKELKKYIIKYGEGNSSSYLNLLLWDHTSQGTNQISFAGLVDIKDNDSFVSGLQNLYETVLVPECTFADATIKTELAHYFDNLFKKTLTINNPGDSRYLHLYLYIPLYDRKVWEQAEILMDSIVGLSLPYQVDIIGLAADTAFLFTPEKEKSQLATRKQEHMQVAAESIRKIVEYKKSKGLISNFLILQNCQEEGFSLDLDIKSYTRIIGEFALLCAEHYNQLFISLPNNENPIKAFGLSVLNFDKYYFVHYLLKRTYLHIMDREKVMDEKVDINRVMQFTQDRLRGKINLFSVFYDKHVLPRISKGESEDRIIGACATEIDELIKDIGKDLESFIDDESLSIPEKRATMATLLGMDDKLLTGYAYNHNSLVIDDLDLEMANMFIEANNQARNSSYSFNAILSQDEDVTFPLEHLKKLRAEIRQSTTYIREKEEQLDKLKLKQKTAEETDKRLTEDGYFVYEGNKYRLLPKNVEEPPLSETYTPPTGLQKVGSVDLRRNFTSVKNQGSQGACSAFTVVSIYEYIIKNNIASELDLSEAFLYYNTRKRTNHENEDCGCTFSDTIGAASEKGLCSETYFPYDEKSYSLEPSEEAYLDGLTRTVKKAVNVKRELNDICSALIEGYPVAISLRVYSSFSNTLSGFVNRPSEKELKSEDWGNHAMVICGFDQEKKIFIVRNSWGTSFGDQGYCYIPFSYITDTKLLNMAIIITEVGSDYQAGSHEKKIQVYFDTTDANIQYAIIHNLVEEEKLRLHYLRVEDNRYRQIYMSLIERLRNNTNRNKLTEGKEQFLQEEADRLLEEQKETRIEKDRILRLTKRETRKNGIILTLSVLSICGMLGIAFWITPLKYALSSKAIWYAIGVCLLLVGLSFLYFPYRKRLYRQLKDEWENRIINLGVRADKLLQEKKKTKLRFHIAGMILDRLFDLQERLMRKYHVMLSFTGNLTSWYKEEEENLEDMDSQTRDPFISLLTNEALNIYFEKNKEKIANDICLSDFVSAYEVTDEGILAFKKNVKEKVILSITSIYKDFKLYSHISGQKDYPYLDKKYTDISKLLPILDKKSGIFLQFTSGAMAEEPHKVIFISLDEEGEKEGWQYIYPKSFSTRPGSENIVSPFKVILFKIMNLDVNQIKISEK